MTPKEIKIIEYLISRKDELSVFIETKEANALISILEEVDDLDKHLDQCITDRDNALEKIDSLQIELSKIKEELQSYKSLPPE